MPSSKNPVEEVQASLKDASVNIFDKLRDKLGSDVKRKGGKSYRRPYQASQLASILLKSTLDPNYKHDDLPKIKSALNEVIEEIKYENIELTPEQIKEYFSLKEKGLKEKSQKTKE